MSPRIAVTGIGVVSPLGQSFDGFGEALMQARGCLRPLSLFDPMMPERPMVGELAELPDAPGGKFASRTDRLSAAAAQKAVREAGLERSDIAAAGVAVATTVSALPEITPEIATNARDYMRHGGWRSLVSYPFSSPADAAAEAVGANGPRFGISVACASGAMSVALAARRLLQGEVRVMIAGGSEALSLFTLCGFTSLRALDPCPCRPFDQSRTGLNLGEGAAMLTLETLEHAKARGARVLAVLRGWAMTNDAHHETAPHPAGAGIAACVRSALAMARIEPGEIGYVNAHGTGTPLNDIAETKAYETAFAERRTPVPVSSTKSYTGHCLGAAGSLEAAVTIAALQRQVLFPTLRLKNPIPSTTVEYIAGPPRPATFGAALKVSAGFGGSNTALVFAREDYER